MFETEFFDHIFRAGFGAKLAPLDQAPVERVSDVDNEWFDSWATALNLLHRIFSRFQPFGETIVGRRGSHRSRPRARRD
jgi:hypothetical protein